MKKPVSPNLIKDEEEEALDELAKMITERHTAESLLNNLERSVEDCPKVNTQQEDAQPMFVQQMNAQQVSAQPVYGQQMISQQVSAQATPKPSQSMMTFPDAINSCFKKFMNFKGRASRAEFWWFFLLFFVVEFLCVQILGDMGLVLILPLLIPLYAVGARRMHDIGRTGWWLLLYLTGLGAIVVLIFACLPSQPAPNKYGDIPCKLQ